MRINSFRSGFLLSSCVVHILYFDIFHSILHLLTPSKSVQKAPKWDTECCNWYLISQTHTPISPLRLLYSCKIKTYYAKKKFKFIIFTVGAGQNIPCHFFYTPVKTSHKDLPPWTKHPTLFLSPQT